MLLRAVCFLFTLPTILFKHILITIYEVTKDKKAAVQNNQLKIEKKARILKENIANIKYYV